MHNLFTLTAILKNIFKHSKVDLAYNGKEALSKVEKKQNLQGSKTAFKVIFMDFEMPIMDGREAT